jgi:hypothetical protein
MPGPESILSLISLVAGKVFCCAFIGIGKLFTLISNGETFDVFAYHTELALWIRFPWMEDDKRSPRRPTTIDTESVAVDHRGFIAGQKIDSVCYFFRLSEPADRYLP